MALPPQIAVPHEIKCDVFFSVLSHFPNRKPKIKVLKIENIVSTNPSFPAENALDAFIPYHHPTVDFVMKLRGFEVLDESAPLTVAGARDGSTFLLTYRFRRPVR